MRLVSTQASRAQPNQVELGMVYPSFMLVVEPFCNGEHTTV